MKRFVAGLIIGLMLGMSGVAYVDDGYIQAVFAKFNFIVNGEKVDPGIDPLVYQGTSYLPVRAISNMLGYDVTYRADNRTIELTKAASEVRNPIVETPESFSLFESVPTATLLNQIKSIDFNISHQLRVIEQDKETLQRIDEEIKKDPTKEIEYASSREIRARSIQIAQKWIADFEAEKEEIFDVLEQRTAKGDVTVTSYRGLKAITNGEKTYFSLSDYEVKFSPYKWGFDARTNRAFLAEYDENNEVMQKLLEVEFNDLETHAIFQREVFVSTDFYREPTDFE